PMPPVLGPASASPRRLWSCDDASGSTCAPSAITMKLASSPSRQSSTTTRAPALPTALPDSIASTAACASAVVSATTTPLPAASPSAFTTTRPSRESIQQCASRASSKLPQSAVGMPWRRMNSLANRFELSSCAAACVGPKIGRPAARNASTMPSASGASGPTTVSRIDSVRANSTSAGTLSNGTFASAGSRAVPALPGATNTFATRGDRASFHASACSRPPPPTTRIFTDAPRSLEQDAPENVQRAAVVDAAVQRRNVGGEQRRVAIAQRHDRQQHRYRDSARDVGPLHHERGEAESGLHAVARTPEGRILVADVELRVLVRVGKHQRVDRVLVAVGILGDACVAGSPRFRIELAAALGRPGERKVPRVAGDEHAGPAILPGVDETVAPRREPRRQVGAASVHRRRSAEHRERAGDAAERARESSGAVAHLRQCLKWRTPVNTMAMPRSSAAAITSASRTLPPGWITATAPWSATTSRPSRNGKNASEATTEPASESPAACAFIAAIRVESTRLIWPAPM